MTLNASALRGVRIGAVKEFFGRNPVELPVSAVVRSALARMQQAGAEVVDISMVQLEAKALSASVIAFEFRDNLAAYLANQAANTTGARLVRLRDQHLHARDGSQRREA